MTEPLIIHTRPDGQVFAVDEVEPGVFQSVFPSDLAEHSQLHTSEADAEQYVNETRCA